MLPLPSAVVATIAAGADSSVATDVEITIRPFGPHPLEHASIQPQRFGREMNGGSNTVHSGNSTSTPIAATAAAATAVPLLMSK